MILEKFQLAVFLGEEAFLSLFFDVLLYGAGVFYYALEEFHADAGIVVGAVGFQNFYVQEACQVLKLVLAFESVFVKVGVGPAGKRQCVYDGVF